jgi:hypothetical protein
MHFSLPTQHCPACGDDSPTDARFCIHCGNAFIDATTGSTVYLGDLTPSSNIAPLTVVVRSITGQRQRAFILGIAIISIGYLILSGSLSQRSTVMPIRQPPTTSTAALLSRSEQPLPKTSPYNFEILANGYLQAMQRRDIPVAAVFIAQKAITEEQRQALLGERQYALIDNYILFGFGELGLHNLDRTGRAVGYIHYPDCIVKDIEVNFIYEDSAWRIVSFDITEDPGLNEERRQQLCVYPTAVQEF